MDSGNDLYALVTGAGQGLGKAIALELAKRHIPLILVSLPGENLSGLCRDINITYGVNARCFEVDLTSREGIYHLVDSIVGKYNIHILINNAGKGGTQAFDQVPPEYIDEIILLNVRAVSMLTRLLVPELMKHPKSCILNVASMASFVPIAYKTVYPATKAFVYSFSRGLNEELKDTNIFVSVLQPGPMNTNPDVSARIKNQGFLGRLGLLSPQETAVIAIRQLFRHDALIIPGFLNKINYMLIKSVPVWIQLSVLGRIVKNEIRELKKNPA